MLKSYPKNLRKHYTIEYGDSYHCHFALKNLLDRVIKINYLKLTSYHYYSFSMTIKIDTTFSFKLPIPIATVFLRDLSTSIYRFTNVKELTLYKALLESTSLTRLKNDHCLRCDEKDCKAFFMSNIDPNP